MQALGVIKLEYFHGDVRLDNIVVEVQNGMFQFSLIDWDTLVSITCDRGIQADRRYPYLNATKRVIWNNHVEKRAEWFTVCQL